MWRDWHAFRHGLATNLHVLGNADKEIQEILRHSNMAKIGKRSGPVVEIEKYLTQDELVQTVAARRERVSTALNFLRRQGAVHYLPHGHLSLNVKALESHAN